MARKLFGTDGIRGQANTEPMTAETCLKVAMATALQFKRGSHRHLAVIGKDTRLSGYMVEPALVAGFIGMGMDVVLLGPVPTPAVAMLTRSLRADLGVMISASHNPFGDNGVKLFGPDGFKLSDEIEQSIEARMAEPFATDLAPSADLGRASRLDDAAGRVIEHSKNAFPKHLRLDGLKIVVDCAHGASYKIAPRVLYELGAEVIAIGVNPDGTNINRGCGAMHPEAVGEFVVQHKADLGIALDGDADRVILVDEKGQVVDGDQVLGLIATSWQRESVLQGDGVVATVMSNLGLERYLQSHNLRLERTAVGDRYVVERMRHLGWNVGGEASGHIVLSDFGTTGDGLAAALQVLACIVTQQKPASEVCRVFTPVPQVLLNVSYDKGSDPLSQASVLSALQSAEAELQGRGRLLVRKSGTEPVIRVMVESDDPKPIAERIASAIKEAAGSPAA